jgi:ubiquinone/menaquinone biosynthesis C-methylase UbiE
MDEALVRERDFHDRIAAENDLASIRPREPDPLEAALFDTAGDMRGQRVLELGCGSGEITIALVERGANVTALDLSPGMVAAAAERVRRYARADAEVEFLVAPAHDVPVAEGAFDLVVGKWILHHVELAALAPELARVMRSDGRAVFIENSGANPVLRFARERVTGRFGVRRIGTEDEHPLLPSDYEVFAPYFSGVSVTYPQFDFFTIFDRQILRYRYRRISRILGGLDRAIHRWLPPLRRYSFRAMLELSGPRPTSSGR